MDYDNNNLKEIELMEKKVADLDETVISIHNTFMYAGSLVIKNAALFLQLAIIGISINLIATSSFGEFIELFRSLDPTNLGEIEQKADELLDHLFKGLATSISLQIISSVFFITFASYICSRKVEDGVFVNDLGNIVTLTLGVFFQLLLLVLIKMLLIIIGFMAIFPGMVFLAQMLFAQYALIFERKGILNAFSRSAKLMYGAKSNFLIFITYASLIFIPAWILDFISGGVGSLFDPKGTVTLVNCVLIFCSELFKQYIWFVYSVGACLLYLRRSAKEQ